MGFTSLCYHWYFRKEIKVARLLLASQIYAGKEMGERSKGKTHSVYSDRLSTPVSPNCQKGFSAAVPTGSFQSHPCPPNARDVATHHGGQRRNGVRQKKDPHRPGSNAKLEHQEENQDGEEKIKGARK
eukprot:GHVT01003155.1.p1 GENE.GHVT01003155.1~~GHVT01003155.1.p1  ORF type:complete len:128 (+),score=2.75 GHVT01003155.1:63-446(+)